MIIHRARRAVTHAGQLPVDASRRFASVAGMLPRPFASARALLLGCALVSGFTLRAAEETSLQRGQAIYARTCAMCHHASGSGVPPVYPPLAKSDWLMADRARTIKVLVEGLSGPITVNGATFANNMPAQMLDDAAVADVLTFVTNSWENKADPFTVDEVSQVRATSRFATFEALAKASAYAPLPTAPAGWKVRELTQLTEMSTRLARRRGGRDVYVLGQNGSVHRLELSNQSFTPIIAPTDYLDRSRGSLDALGMTQDDTGRLWIVTNQRIAKPGALVTNEVVIYRTTTFVDGVPSAPKPWFKTTYPWGIGPYNHGVSHLAFGPDGMLYASSGSRTDGGEAGTKDEFFKGGETDVTAAMWRLDPKSDTPKIEIFSRGLRNVFGFAWDDRGDLFSVTNGPDANAPEEMDHLEKDGHYGFPYQFSNWPMDAGSPYPHTPVAPANANFKLPLINLGPAGGGSAEAPLSTFHAHSSPAGMAWAGDNFAAPLKGSFLVTRFGNLLGGDFAPVDVGFDLLSCRPEKNAKGEWQVRTTTILAPLGRPIDVLALEDGRAIILEYTRPTSFRSNLGWLPGRIIELAPAR